MTLTLHKSEVHYSGIKHGCICSSLNPLLCRKREVAKLGSGLFYYWPLLNNNNMAKCFQVFTSIYDSRRFAACAGACRGLMMPGVTAWLYSPLPNSSIEQWRMVVTGTGYMPFATSHYEVIITLANQRFSEVCSHNIRGVASLKIRGRAKMFDFRRITLFCLEKRLSKHKITIFCGGCHGPFVPHPGYAYAQHAYYSTRTLLTRCYTMCHCNEHKLPALQFRRPEENTALNTKTGQFIIAKIPGNALKQETKTHSVLRQCSSQLKKYNCALKPWSETHSTLRQASLQLQIQQAARMSRRIAVEHEVCGGDGGHPR